MPVVLRVKGYRFGFYASDRDEPPHVHVRRNGHSAKYWLQPAVRLENSSGFPARHLNEVERLVQEHRDELLEAWHGYFR